MSAILQGAEHPRKAERGFSLAEVVIAMAVLALLIQGVIYGYVDSSRRAEWSCHSLAAQSLASQGVEQARAAKWDPQAWPPVDELAPTNYVEVDTLDLPRSGLPIYATNYISVMVVSTNPLVREIRADCVWNFLSRGRFTNTIITFRAPDQ